MLLKNSFIGFYTIEHIQWLLRVSRLFYIIKDFWSLNKKFERQSTEYFFKNPSKSSKVLYRERGPWEHSRTPRLKGLNLHPIHALA